MKSQDIKIVACSGASNTGEYTDRIVRNLTAKGKTKMICLAKISTGDQKLIEEIKTDETPIIIIDGCPFNCAEKILSREGIKNYKHLNITDFNVIKGKTPVSEEKINEITDYIINHFMEQQQ